MAVIDSTLVSDIKRLTVYSYWPSNWPSLVALDSMLWYARIISGFLVYNDPLYVEKARAGQFR